MRKTTIAAIVTILFVLAPGFAYADFIILEDLNTEVMIDPYSQDGMFSWTVDGTQHLFQQWFWYRIGATGGEKSIDTMTLDSFSYSSNSATLTYKGDGLQIDIIYTVLGGTEGSNTSDIGEQIRIIDLEDGIDTDTISFFQYSDFDLDGTADDDVVRQLNKNVVQQIGENFEISETSAIQTPDGVELALYDFTLAHLNDGDPSLLPPNFGTGGPVFGDVTWAFQWNFDLIDGGTFLISKNKLLRAPEPASLLLLGTGLALIGIRRRQNRLR
jgi:hypothetical protein